MKYFRLLIISLVFIAPIGLALATVSNIHSDFRYAWNDAIGWLDFYSTSSSDTNRVIVTANKLTGSGIISSTGDYVSLDCETSPTGNICDSILSGGAPVNWFVSVAPAYESKQCPVGSTGNNYCLAGWAWSDSIGWISFCGNSSGGSAYNTANRTWDCPGSPTYRVTGVSDNNRGTNFQGYAWNDNVGWISFNCSDEGTCGNVNYRLQTYWPGSPPSNAYLISSTQDTCPTGNKNCISGVAYNYMLWRGSLNDPDNSVSLQLATSNCANGATNAPTCDQNAGWGGVKIGDGICSSNSCDGAFLGPRGTSGDKDVYVPLANTSTPVSNQYHNNKRYYRYKVFLYKGTSNSSPVVTDVIVNWSF